MSETSQGRSARCAVSKISGSHSRARFGMLASKRPPPDCLQVC